jgi:midasin (ATPase involved in ribosome maturation)
MLKNRKKFFVGRKLHVINLSHQAETSDLFGGYKPVEFRSQMYSLMESFLELFAVTFSVRGNESFLTNCQVKYRFFIWNFPFYFYCWSFQTAFSQKNWTTLAAGMRHIANSGRKKSNTTGKIDLSQQVNSWDVFSESLAVVEKQLSLHQRSLIFAFLEVC